MAILQIPVTKSKGFVSIDTDVIPQHVYNAALAEGLKVLANRGAAKITKAAYEGDEERMKAAAQAQAEKQAAAMLDGSIKLPGKKASTKETGEVMTEARRIARNVVKDLMKKNGIKVSHVKASQITAAANDLLAQDPTLIDKARAEIEARKALPVAGAFDIKALIQEDPELVAKDEAKKARDKANKPLSAKQAGRTKARGSKPGLSA